MVLFNSTAFVHQHTPQSHAAGCSCKTCSLKSASREAAEKKGSGNKGSETQTYQVSAGAAAFTTVAKNGERLNNGGSRNVDQLKWTRQVTRDDGSKAIAVNFAFAYNFDIPGIKKGRAKTLVKKAFQAWAQHAPIEFQEIKYRPKEAASIDIVFEGKSIDGRGKTLAEAFFPGVGDVAFDTDETWTDSRFVEAALHEIGHALGLDHVSGVDAIMNARIGNRFDNPNKPALEADDIAGIKWLYGEGVGGVTTLNGKRQAAPPVTTPVTVTPQLGPDLVTNGSFETIPVKDGEFGLYSRITGWRRISGTGFRVDKRSQTFGKAADGKAWAALDIYDSNATIGQNVDTLTGQAYQLSVDYSNGGEKPDTAGIDLFWDGKKVDSLTGGGKGKWKNFTFEVEGGDRKVSTLAFRATGLADSIGGLIDNISVKAIQAPQPQNLIADNISLGTTSQQASSGLPAADGSSSSTGTCSMTASNLGANSFSRMTV